jgi:hypothetical protein
MSKTLARVAVVAVMALGAAGCGDDQASQAMGSDLSIERRVGFAVVVDDSGEALMIGFSGDRDAESGEAFDITQAVWRQEEGPWNEPPVTCVGRGQRVELGITQVQNEAQPGLLEDRVVWIACLAPPEQ